MDVVLGGVGLGEGEVGFGDWAAFPVEEAKRGVGWIGAVGDVLGGVCLGDGKERDVLAVEEDLGVLRSLLS